MIDLKLKNADQMDRKRPTIFCKNFVPILQGAVSMLFAGGGTGKSYSSIKIAIEYALETGRKVALWLTEDTEGENRYRFDSICRDCYPNKRDYLLQRVIFIGAVAAKFSQLHDGNAKISKEFLETRLVLADYGMVIIDPLLQFNGCSEDSNTQAGVLMGALKEWAGEEKKSILLIHHATKMTSRDGKTSFKPRGAGEWVNGCRAVYNASKSNLDGYLDFTLTKDNGISWCFKDDHTGELKRQLKIFPPWEKEQDVSEKEQKPFISVANHNSVSPDGFIKVEVETFYEIHKLVSAGKAYSQYEFKDGYRLGDNNQGNASFICLDYDDGMTIEQAKKKFSKLQSLIITTRSHQKDKSGTKCDRFRVILSLDSPLSIPLADYPAFLDALNTATGGEVDRSTKDLARFYFASPDNAEFYYSDSEKRMNWRLIYEKMKADRVKENIKKRIAESSTVKRESYSGKPHNTLPKNTMFETKNGSQSFETLRLSLSEGDKEICKCVDGIDHGNAGKHHYSAFVKKEGGNVFYHCSGGRCSQKDTLWCEE